MAIFYFFYNLYNSADSIMMILDTCFKDNTTFISHPKTIMKRYQQYVFRKRDGYSLVQAEEKVRATLTLGIVLRSVGHGHKVGMIQFIKGEWYYGELSARRLKPEFEMIAQVKDLLELLMTTTPQRITKKQPKKLLYWQRGGYHLANRYNCIG